MKFLKVVFLITLVTPWHLSANAIHLPQKIENGCSLEAAPSNFHVEYVSTNWADVSWELVPGANKYLIKTYDIATGAEVHSVQVSGTTTMTRVSWPDNSSGHLEARAWTLNYNNEISSDFVTAPIIGVILELVATGFQRSNAIEAPCVVGTTPNSCASFPWGITNTTTFNVELPSSNLLERYDITGFNNTIRLNRNLNGNMSFEINNEMFVISRNGSQVARLIPVLAVGGNLGYLYRQALDNDYVIKKIGSFASARPMGYINQDRNNTPNEAPLNFQVSPNPFNDLLQWTRPAESPAAVVKISLMDLMGICRLQQELPADQTNGALYTANLLPGVYWLQIESPNSRQSIKVIKI